MELLLTMQQINKMRVKEPHSSDIDLIIYPVPGLIMDILCTSYHINKLSANKANPSIK